MKRMPIQNGPYILTRRSVNSSARVLAHELNLQKSYEPRAYPPVIRWGNSEGYWANDTIYNSSEMIHTVANKKRFSDKMDQLQIPHVEVCRGVPTKFPVVIRQTLTGSKGIGISICENKDQFQNEFYDQFWTPWYNFRPELGVHVLGGRVVKIFKKIWQGEGEEPKYPIKNLNRGYKFSLVVNTDPFKKLFSYMENVFQKFPIQMGRFDIGYDRDNSTYRIIEINSAPGLTENENTLQEYLTFLKEKVNA